MTNAKLLSLSLERFKCFEAKTTIDFAPLTVVLGRNNSGKSSLIQSLLLLKQTLAEPRPEVTLHLDGTVPAFNLRELTSGWPPEGDGVLGPVIGLTWSTRVDIEKALGDARYPNHKNLAKDSGIDDFAAGWLDNPYLDVLTSIRLHTRDTRGTTELQLIELGWTDDRGQDLTLFSLSPGSKGWTCKFRGEEAGHLSVELDHFIPHLQLDRSNAPERLKERAWYNTYLILFAQPLSALKRLLIDLQYLGSTREVPPSLYRSSNIAPKEIGVSGELAAQLLHRRQRDLVHYLPPLHVDGDALTIPSQIEEASLVDAVNAVMEDLSIQAPLSIENIQEVGFRLLFGQANLLHVGRGLTYLLPFIELGLFADPLRFEKLDGRTDKDDYNERCTRYAHLAVEETEAHLHPKVQSRLAHWLVSLAMSRRRLIVETHSDHLVRRLRGLVARAGAGSELERWLLENVVILEVEQGDDGRSTVTRTRLTAEGGIEDHWPADFMDEAGDEDSSIYYAALDKAEKLNPARSHFAPRTPEAPRPTPNR